MYFTVPADGYRLYRDEADAAVLQRLDPVPVPVPQLLLVQTSLAQQVGSWRAQFTLYLIVNVMLYFCTST